MDSTIVVGIIGGGASIIVPIITYVLTSKSEKKKAKQELDNFNKKRVEDINKIEKQNENDMKQLTELHKNEIEKYKLTFKNELEKIEIEHKYEMELISAKLKLEVEKEGKLGEQSAINDLVTEFIKSSLRDKNSEISKQFNDATKRNFLNKK